jgi:hypothetical protein
MPTTMWPVRRVVARTVAWLAAAGAVALVISTQAIGAGDQPPPVQPGEQQARKVCGACHTFPPPDILPRGAWRDEFVAMMFIREGRLPPVGPRDRVFPTIRLPDDMAEVLTFYTTRAPERLPAPEAWPDPVQSPLRFSRRTLTMTGMPGTAAVSNVQVMDRDGDKRLDIFGTDMRQGVVFTAPAAEGSALSVLASIPHPAHVTLADVDGDGLKDLLVGDLGGFIPADHDKGAVIWLRALATGKYSAFWLDGWPRVADVQAADFNGDGRNDLAVAAFGWRKSGRVSILENRPASPARPDFVEHVVDKRPGGIQIIPADLNRDGRMDFVTLLAQEHETVLAYINRGTGFAFDQKVIYAAPHPNWGSSGIQLVDLDKDGDNDVLFTHGDSFDDGVVKPYHGIQWLENRGSYPFVEHTLAAMPGVHRAAAADLDGDGDLDVVAAALLAAGSDIDETRLPALAWLEQTRPGIFVRHTIEMGRPRHATLDVADIDNDGDLDIVAGNFSMEQASGAWVDVWVNQKK